MTPDPDATTRLPRVGADPEADTGPIPRTAPAEHAEATGSTGTAGTTQPAEPDAASTSEEPADRAMPTLLEQMGGVAGIVASTIPVAVFVIVNVLFSLQPALIAAIAAGVLVAVYRIVRKQALQPAISGLFGVAVCAFIAYRTGEARGFYLPGLLYSAVLGLAFLVSIAVRWPLAGVIWNAVNGRGQGWRRNPHMLRAYSWASALWALVFVARLVVQGWLYNVDAANWLGIARLAMGYPLLGVAIVGTVLAVRRAEKAEKDAEATA